MGLFSKLFGSPHPSTQWPAVPGLTIALDLNTPALSGLRLGDSVNRLPQFGPPDKVEGKPSEAEDYVYARHGFSIQVTDQAVESWIIFFDPASAGEKCAPFRGQVTYNGQTASLDKTTTVDDFRRRFGEPYWIDVDESESLLFYEFGRVEWQVEFAGGRLSVLNVVTPPLLSDPAQRAAYGDDIPWPPTGAPPCP